VQGWSIRRTSAKEGAGVEEVFFELARQTLSRQRARPGPSISP